MLTNASHVACQNYRLFRFSYFESFFFHKGFLGVHLLNEKRNYVLVDIIEKFEDTINSRFNSISQFEFRDNFKYNFQ